MQPVITALYWASKQQYLICVTPTYAQTIILFSVFVISLFPIVSTLSEALWMIPKTKITF